MDPTSALPAGAHPDEMVCALCGARVSDDAVPAAGLAWVRGVENGRLVWTCATCARTHLRSIEGKLDSAWW